MTNCLLNSKEGVNMEYASRSVGNAGLATGIIGTTLGVLNGGANMLNFGGRNSDCYGHRCSDNEFVNRYELNMETKLMEKNTEIAILKSDKYTDQKMVEVYANLEGQINNLAKEVRDNKDKQCEVNREQAVYNGVNTSMVAGLKNQIDQLFSLTALRIPNTSVCPGWGEVKVVPVTPTTTATATVG